MTLAVMGCIVNGPGESRHANIGISLPGTGETPAAPVFVDGEKKVTLRGDNIAQEFVALIDDYVEHTYVEAPDKPAILAAPESASGFRHWMARNAWRLVLLFGGVLLPLAGFVALADEVHEFESFHFDAPLLWQMHGLHSPWLDRFFVLISKLGYEWFLIPADVLIIGVLLGYRRWREATFVAVSFVGSALLNMGSKQFFQRQRPSLWESIAPESTFSFPSGHAMGSMTLAVTLVLLAWNTRWRWPVLMLAPAFSLLVSVSRVYLGVHYPSDILAGWCAALVWVVGCYLVMFSRRHPWRRHGPPPAKASEAPTQGFDVDGP